MKIKTTFLALFLILAFLVLPIKNSWGGGAQILDVLVTDSKSARAVVGFYDLRDRETLIQITNTDTEPAGRVYHIQFWDVGNNCTENNFFDTYTPNDTHVYNVRDLQTNDGNPSGVVLPEDSYGIFVAYIQGRRNQVIIGNMRILDDNGYEYRTNLVGIERSLDIDRNKEFATFNFNTLGGVTLSDIVGFVAGEARNEDDPNELFLEPILDIWTLAEVDIIDLDENVSSCRNVIFACVNEDHPLREALIEEVQEENEGGISVASFEYGINEAIPHSKGGELLCPGNTISEGFVRLFYLEKGSQADDEHILFVGLNNGNGRGTMDVFWANSCTLDDRC